MRKTVQALLGVSFMLVASVVHATPVLVGFPPDGGVTLAQAGPGSGFGTGDPSVPNDGVGRTNTYTNFDPITGAYSSLWWGPTSVIGPALSTASAATGQTLTLQSISGNEAIFDAANWTIQTSSGFITVPVRLALETFTTGGAPIALMSSGSVPGLTGSAGVVVDVTPYLSTGFAADFVFEALVGGTWTGVDQYFNSLSTLCTGCVTKSFTGGFWEEKVTASAVPEPASLILIGSGMMAMARLRRSRRAN